MIRLAEKSDLPEILECLQALSDTSTSNMNELHAAFRERELTNIYTFVYKHNQDSKIDGVASVILKRKLSHGGLYEAEISDVVVMRNYQGLGIGKELIRACIDFCKSAKVYKIILTCKTELIDFYGKFGFNTVGNEMRMDL